MTWNNKNRHRHEVNSSGRRRRRRCGGSWNERWDPATLCPQNDSPPAPHYMTPLTMAMKVGHSEQTDQAASKIRSYITDIKSHYPQWKSIADVVKMKRPLSGFPGQLTKEHCSKWYHFSVINRPPGRWPCLKPTYSVTYNVCRWMACRSGLLGRRWSAWSGRGGVRAQ